MKFDCGPTPEEKRRAKAQRKAAKRAAWKAKVYTPHKWFAWFPVQVGSHDCRWLEHVERHGRIIENYIGDESVSWTYKALS